MRRTPLSALLVLSCLLAGCGPGLHRIENFVHPEYSQVRPRRIAVLPPSNASTQAFAVPLMMILAGENLPKYGYVVRDPRETYKYFEFRSVIDGEMLGTWVDNVFNFHGNARPERLCKDLDVDGVLVGRISQFNHIELIIARTRVVEITWSLVNKDGVIVWTSTGRGQTSESHEDGEDAAEAFFQQIAIRTAEDAKEAPLYIEALQATYNCFNRLSAAGVCPPVPPFAVPPEVLERHAKRKAKQKPKPRNPRRRRRR